MVEEMEKKKHKLSERKNRRLEIAASNMTKAGYK